MRNWRVLGEFGQLAGVRWRLKMSGLQSVAVETWLLLKTRGAKWCQGLAAQVLTQISHAETCHIWPLKDIRSMNSTSLKGLEDHYVILGLLFLQLYLLYINSFFPEVKTAPIFLWWIVIVLNKCKQDFSSGWTHAPVWPFDLFEWPEFCRHLGMSFDATGAPGDVQAKRRAFGFAELPTCPRSGAAKINPQNMKNPLSSSSTYVCI